MTMQNAQSNSGSTLVLKTNIFNDEEMISNSLQIELTDNVNIVDISDKQNADFTSKDWDRILKVILSCSKVITV